METITLYSPPQALAFLFGRRPRHLNRRITGKLRVHTLTLGLAVAVTNEEAGTSMSTPVVVCGNLAYLESSIGAKPRIQGMGMGSSLPQYTGPVMRSATIGGWGRGMLAELHPATPDRLCAEQVSEILILASLTAMRASHLRCQRLHWLTLAIRLDALKEAIRTNKWDTLTIVNEINLSYRGRHRKILAWLNLPSIGSDRSFLDCHGGSPRLIISTKAKSKLPARQQRKLIYP